MCQPGHIIIEISFQVEFYIKIRQLCFVKYRFSRGWKLLDVSVSGYFKPGESCYYTSSTANAVSHRISAPFQYILDIKLLPNMVVKVMLWDPNNMSHVPWMPV